MDIINYFINHLGEPETPMLWEDLSSEETRQINELAENGTLKKIDPIGISPMFEGVVLYFLDTDGRLVVFEVGTDLLSYEKGRDFYCQMAIPYPFRFINNKGRWCILF